MYSATWKSLLLLFLVKFNTKVYTSQDGGHNNSNEETTNEKVSAYAWDPSGYVIYCPCMGRFGNQAEQFLGALAFSKYLNRTLILPPWRTYVNVPFTEFFQFEPLQAYHRVITAEEFMRHLAPQYWPKGSRRGYCWVVRDTDQCVMKIGNPFKNFWDELGVDFDEFITYTLPYDMENPKTVSRWTNRFPAADHPVLAFRGPPARFPVAEHDRSLQQYLKWSVHIDNKSSEFINTSLPDGPFVGIHLRNGQDWAIACNHVQGSGSFMASPQCLGFSGKRKVTKEICFPSKEEIIQKTTKVVKEIKAKSVFVATDRDPMVQDLEKALQHLGVQIVHLNPHLPQMDLAVLGKADHFIGNCVSTFSAFVKRHRDVQSLPSSFWAFDATSNKDEL